LPNTHKLSCVLFFRLERLKVHPHQISTLQPGNSSENFCRNLDSLMHQQKIRIASREVV